MGLIQNYLYYTFRFIVFVITNLYALPCYITWMTLLYPLRWFASDLYWMLESHMFKLLQVIMITWIDSGSYKIFECGDDISLLHDKEAIVMCNHQSTADIPVLMLSIFGKRSAPGTAMWIMFVLFKYTNFGMVSSHRQDFFIDQGKAKREFQLIKLKEHLKNSYLPHHRKWICIFPEGGFLWKRLKASQEFGQKNGFPILNHATLPRIGAIKTILDTVGEPFDNSGGKKGRNPGSPPDDSSSNESEDPERPLKWIIDTTIAYKDAKPLDMFGMCVGYCPHDDVMIHHRAYRVRNIPREETAFTAWLYERYKEKDDFLEKYYEDGTLPDDAFQEQRPLPKIKATYLRFDRLFQLLVHIFFILSCYVHYIYIFEPVASLSWRIIGYLF